MAGTWASLLVRSAHTLASPYALGPLDTIPTESSLKTGVWKSNTGSLIHFQPSIRQDVDSIVAYCRK